MATILTEWEIPTRFNGEAGNYHALVKRSNSADSWAEKIAGAGNTTLNTASSVEVDPAATTDKWTDVSLTDVAVDMTDKLLLKISAAKFWFYCYQHNWTGSPWAASDDNEWVVCQQNEDVRGLDLATVNYQEIIQGANQPLSTYTDDRVDMTASQAGTWLEFDANAAGLAYLNSIGTKTYMQGTALFSLVPYGIVTGHNPVWATGGSKAYNLAFFNSVWLSLYYDDTDQPLVIRPSFDWRIAETAQISISETWRDVVGIQISVNESWETVK